MNRIFQHEGRVLLAGRIALYGAATEEVQIAERGRDVIAANTINVYRVFSNRSDANHRYMTDRAVRDDMVSKGWLAEGDGPDFVVMCAPS